MNPVYTAGLLPVSWPFFLKTNTSRYKIIHNTHSFCMQKHRHLYQGWYPRSDGSPRPSKWKSLKSRQARILSSVHRQFHLHWNRHYTSYKCHRFAHSKKLKHRCNHDTRDGTKVISSIYSTVRIQKSPNILLGNGALLLSCSKNHAYQIHLIRVYLN